MDNRILGDPGTPRFQVGKYPFFLLNRLASRYNSTVERALRAIELDVPAWRVLMILGERAPRGVRDIANAAVIPLSTMTRIVQRMQTAGYVLASTSIDDLRVTEVQLTKTGEAKLEEARAVTSPIYHSVIASVSSAEFDTLVDLLGRLYDNLDDSAPREA